MKKYINVLNMRAHLMMMLLCGFIAQAQNNNNDALNHDNIRADFKKMLNTIENSYVYFEDKNITLSCIEKHYSAKIPLINTPKDTVLFFEYLLNEFYDNHINLNVNTASSYRLNAPIYVKKVKEKTFITNINKLYRHLIKENIIGAEILSFNGVGFSTMIKQFPSHCQDKNDDNVQQWIANKIMAGRYDQPRTIQLKLRDGTVTQINPDNWQVTKNDQLLTAKVVNKIGIINIHNALGNNQLIHAFDEALDNMLDTKAVIIDLRNTISGGNSYVARAIMGRFVSQEHAYQKHSYTESWDNQASVDRIWIEYVSSRGLTYEKPVVILVDQWTASMGEGLAVGFDALDNATIIGSDMQKLAGAISRFNLDHHKFTYQLSNEKLFHINGTPREKYIPPIYVQQKTPWDDTVMKKALDIINADH